MQTTINDIRSHVIEDAADLISVIAIVKPLITGDQLRKIGREREQVAWFLRKLLSRNMILICARLHEPSGSGPTGETASVETLLGYAHTELPSEMVAEFHNRRIAIIAKLESQGTRFSELRDFRTAEMAHSIHRGLPYSDNLFYSTIEEFAEATCALVVDLDKALVESGLKKYNDVPELFSVWRERGETFWKMQSANRL